MKANEARSEAARASNFGGITMQSEMASTLFRIKIGTLKPAGPHGEKLSEKARQYHPAATFEQFLAVNKIKIL